MAKGNGVDRLQANRIEDSWTMLLEQVRVADGIHSLACVLPMTPFNLPIDALAIPVIPNPNPPPSCHS